jgi:hypothetical protein
MWNRRGEILEKLNIPGFRDLPVLDLGLRGGMTDYIDFLVPEDVPQPLMKGKDKFHRPFIALKIRDQTSQSTRVLTLFQRYSNSDTWVKGAEGFFDMALFHGGLLTPAALGTLQQVIAGSHPRYSLAAPGVQEV